MKKKKGIIITGITLLLLLVVGVTYAFFTYESGTKNDIVTGQIYMNYEETSTISLTGVFPETKEQALSRTDENGVFEFTITGRNTSKYPVYYEIDLLEGGVMTGKTEQSTKILPEHVRIYLERDGDPLVDGMTYKDWNNRRIYVDTIPANQTSNIEHKYTLRMWIDENVTISDTDPNADYTTAEWNDAYTSLKVRVVGDFEWKEVATDSSCFAYNIIDDSNVITYNYLTELTLDTSEEKVEACIAFNESFLGPEEEGNTVDVGETYEAFCNGTGTNWGYTLKEVIAGGFFTDEQIQSLGVIESYEIETRYYELNTSEESVNACMEYMPTIFNGEDMSTAQDGYQSFCEGTGTLFGEESIFSDFVIINFGYGLIERNVFTQVEKLPQAIEITAYNNTCEKDVIIPSQIEGLPVTRIAGRSDLGGDFGPLESYSLTSIKFPNTLKHIGDNAFGNNKLTSVVIPDSVTYIGYDAFMGNPLVTVNVKGNPTLGDRSFYADSYDYPDGVFNFQTFQYGGTCEEMRSEYVDAFYPNLPQVIITSDNSSCQLSD